MLEMLRNTSARKNSTYKLENCARVIDVLKYKRNEGGSSLMHIWNILDGLGVFLGVLLMHVCLCEV